MILIVTNLSLLYLIATLSCKWLYGEYLHYKFIHSYQTHLEGNVMSIHIMSSIVMFLTMFIQMKRGRDTVHKWLGRLFMSNIILVMFPTSLYLSLGVYSKDGTELDTIVIRMMFLESAFGVLFASIFSWYSIAFDSNMVNHKKLMKVCASYSLTPLLDRFLIYLLNFYFTYDVSHSIAICILFMNMVSFGFFDKFVFVNTGDRFKPFKRLSILRWQVYLLIIHFFHPFRV